LQRPKLDYNSLDTLEATKSARSLSRFSAKIFWQRLKRFRLQMRNATLGIIWEILNEWRKNIEGLKGEFHLPIFDVTAGDSPVLDVLIIYVPILEDSREGAQKECKNQEDVMP
jgi:hypothetical protein